VHLFAKLFRTSSYTAFDNGFIPLFKVLRSAGLYPQALDAQADARQ
jgi:hypothetical protein